MRLISALLRRCNIKSKLWERTLQVLMYNICYTSSNGAHETVLYIASLSRILSQAKHWAFSRPVEWKRTGVFTNQPPFQCCWPSSFVLQRLCRDLHSPNHPWIITLTLFVFSFPAYPCRVEGLIIRTPIQLHSNHTLSCLNVTTLRAYSLHHLITWTLLKKITQDFDKSHSKITITTFWKTVNLDLSKMLMSWGHLGSSVS